MSSSSASLADYRAALTAPGAVLPVFASALARFPIAMIGLAMLLFVERTTGSYASAGLVSAGGLVGVSIGSVVQGRLMDRVGATRPLLGAALLLALAMTGLISAVLAELPVPVLVGLALVAGFVQPAMPGASRALWGDLVPAGSRREAAYSYEAISLEVFFILGPAVAALLVTTPWPATGLTVAASAMVLGASSFALSPAVRRTGAGPVGPSVGLLGALARPGMRTVALASLGFGLVIGSVEVGIPAVTDRMGTPALGGVLLSAWSVTSVLAGVLYSMRPWPRPMHLRMPALLAGFAICVGVMAFAGPYGADAGPAAVSLPLLVVAMLLAGSLITPQVTAHSVAVDMAAPAGTATEAFGWVVTAATFGIAVGQSSAGIVVESVGPAGAFVSGCVLGVIVAVGLWVLRGTLRPRPAKELAPA